MFNDSIGVVNFALLAGIAVSGFVLTFTDGMLLLLCRAGGGLAYE